jgi:hypothetical protein
MTALALSSRPFAPFARAHVVAPYDATLRPVRAPLDALTMDPATAGAFAIERLDELDAVDLVALGLPTMLPDGRPARALRIAFRRLAQGALALEARPFVATLHLEADVEAMAGQLRPVAADGFRESREEAERLRRARIASLPGASGEPDDAYIDRELSGGTEVLPARAGELPGARELDELLAVLDAPIRRDAGGAEREEGNVTQAKDKSGGHCRADRSTCRTDYCACQCDACFDAHFGRPRTQADRDAYKASVGAAPPASAAPGSGVE